MDAPSNKQLFVCRYNDYDGLGLGHPAVRKLKELSVPDGYAWVQVACGPYHTASVSSNGDLFTWGDGKYGVLGHGDVKRRDTPKKVKIPGGETVVKVACGRRHTAAVTATGKLFTWYVSYNHALQSIK